MRVAGLLSVAVLTACDATRATAPLPPNVEIVQPPCEQPAPLLGHFDPAAPGYFVVYREGVDADRETDRLAVKYDFQPRYVYRHVLRGFSAELTPQVLAEVRCEATVDFTQFVMHGTLDG